MKKPTKKQCQELREFKLRVQLEIHNAIMLQRLQDDKVIHHYHPYVVNIMGAEFTLYPNDVYWLENELKKSVDKFTTTVW